MVFGACSLGSNVMTEDLNEKKAIEIVLQELKDRLPSSQYVGFMPSDEVKKAMKLVEKFLK